MTCIAAARIYRACRRVGITPRGMVDCMIASVAHRHRTPLLALDADLGRVADVIGIEMDEAPDCREAPKLGFLLAC